MRKHEYRSLFPSFAPPSTWRVTNVHFEIRKGQVRVVKDEEDKKGWKRLKPVILQRDDYMCQYCGFRAPKWQMVHHIDGDNKNNDLLNLTTVCPMCHRVLHVGLGCTVLKTVDLYLASKFSQVEIIRTTREMRSAGHDDRSIIKRLGLKGKKPFKTDKLYLKSLLAFITSRAPKQPDWCQRGIEYGYDLVRLRIEASKLEP